MKILADQIFATLGLPWDSKLINLILDEDRMIVETIPEYLTRVDLNSRYLGLSPVMLFPNGTYEINDFLTQCKNGPIYRKQYIFDTTIEDIGLVEWALPGVQGIQGISGGEDGAQGAIGSQGNIGITTQGTQGTQGSYGIQGHMGTLGLQGVQGHRGSQGLVGYGAQGIAGSTQEIQGIQGNIGIQGHIGTLGIQGVQGTRGTQGIQGSQGSLGIQGDIGSQGILGSQGQIGESIQGSAGYIGEDGSQGAIGSQGTAGYVGEDGTQGAIGSQGDTGSQGTIGIQGDIGIQGTQGLSIQGQVGESVQGELGSQGNQGPQGVQGPAGGGGGGVSEIIDVTYNELVVFIGSSQLVPNQNYRITDYQTIHYMLDGNGDVCLDGDLIPYVNTGTVEPLIVTATSINSLSPAAHSEDYPQDIIHYDWNPDNWKYDLGFSAWDEVVLTGWRGCIYYREDTKNMNILGYDFRNVKFRRWKMNYPEYDPLVTYSKSLITSFGTPSNIVQHPDHGIMISAKDNNLNQLAGGYWSYIINNQYSGGNYFQSCMTDTNDPTDFRDYYTFSEIVEGPSYELMVKNNRFSVHKDNTVDWWGVLASILSGNVFFLTDSSYSELTDNEFGLYFELNTIIPDDLTGNKFGMRCSGNIIEGSFRNNIIHDDFKFNLIGRGFSNNLIGSGFTNNYLISEFSSNNIGYQFGYNLVFGQFYGNKTLGYMAINNIDIYCESNIFGIYIFRNKIGRDFRYNQIGSYFVDNVFRTYCQYNTIGCSFRQNSLGDYITNNTFGDLTYLLSMDSYIRYNTFESGISTLAVSVGGSSSIPIRYNRFLGGINNKSITDITHLLANYNCEVYQRPDGALKLKYMDNNDALIIISLWE